jgi:hypothetical protein
MEMPVAGDQLFSVVIEDGRPVTRGSAAFEISKAVAQQRGRVATSSWRWDGTTLRAKTSRTGLIPLYYRTSPGRFAIGTRLFEVAAALGSVSLDRTSILLHYAIRHYVGDRTPFSEVRVLTLDSALTWDAGNGVKVVRAPRPIEPWRGDRAEAIRRYDELVRAAVAASRGPEHHAIGLSGGRDTRHILLALISQGLGVERIVSIYNSLWAPHTDARIAAALAKRIGKEAEIVPAIADRVTAEIEKNRDTELQTLSHSWGLGLADALAGSRTLYDGMGGAHLGRIRLVRNVKKVFPDGKPDWGPMREAALNALMSGHALENVPPFLLWPEIVEEARSVLLADMDRYADYPNPLQAYRYFDNVVRDSALFTLRMMPAREVICPIDDEHVVDFGLGLPWEMSSDPTFQVEALRTSYPDFADIPFDNEVPPTGGPKVTDPAAERRTLERALDFVGRAWARGVAPNIDALLAQPEFDLVALQKSVYALQLAALRDFGDVTLGVIPDASPRQIGAGAGRGINVR